MSRASVDIYPQTVAHRTIDETQYEELKKRDIDVPASVTSHVIHMQRMMASSRTMPRDQLDQQALLLGASLGDFIGALKNQGQRLELLLKNRGFSIPAGEPLERPVPLDRVEMRGRHMVVGEDILLREACEAVYANDSVRVVDVQTGALVYKTSYEQADLEFSRDIHLNSAERQAKKLKVAPAAAYLAFA